MPGTTPLIYAELLSNIRQISVIAGLETLCDAYTNVELSGDGQQVILSHGAHSTTLQLPGRVAPNAQLSRPTIGSKELSWRLPLAAQTTRPDVEGAQSNEAPWSARTLEGNSEFMCRDCGAVIIREGAIKTWKDLPSENWAEMMDFWHCHKPDVPEHEQDHETGPNGASGHKNGNSTENAIATTKGYGANTKFTAISGTAFVDITTFLLAASDCTNLEPLDKQMAFSSGTTPKIQTVRCKDCSQSIGYLDQLSEGIKLWKWSIKLSPGISKPLPSQKPSISSIIATQISSVLQAQCCSRLLLLPVGWKSSAAATDSTQTPTSESSSLVSLWVLMPTLRYSATASNKLQHDSGILAMKVFWKAVTEEEAVKLVNTVEEVPLPSEAIKEISKCLRDSALLLPPSARKFQGWNVGLLERWERKDK